MGGPLSIFKGIFDKLKMAGQTSPLTPAGAMGGGMPMPTASSTPSPQDYVGFAQKMLSTGPMAGVAMNPNLIFPSQTQTGTPTWFGQHPRATSALEGGILAAGAMPGIPVTPGQSIAQVAGGLTAYPQAKRQLRMQQLMMPYEMASAMTGMQKTLAESEQARAHAQFFRQYGAFRQAEADNWGKIADARMKAAGKNLQFQYDGQGNIASAYDPGTKEFFSREQLMQKFGVPQMQEGVAMSPGGEPYPTGQVMPMPGLTSERVAISRTKTSQVLDRAKTSGPVSARIAALLESSDEKDQALGHRMMAVAQQLNASAAGARGQTPFDNYMKESFKEDLSNAEKALDEWQRQKVATTKLDRATMQAKRRMTPDQWAEHIANIDANIERSQQRVQDTKESYRKLFGGKMEEKKQTPAPSEKPTTNNGTSKANPLGLSF